MSPEFDEASVAFCRHVVVVEIEAAPGEPRSVCEGVQLIERGIADQMRPQCSMGWPHGLVDQNHPVPFA